MRSTHDCIGLYSLRHPRLDRTLYNQFLSWFARKGCSVDTIGLTPPFRTMRKFKRMVKKIEQLKLSETLGLELNCHAEGAKNQIEDCKLVVDLSVSEPSFAFSSRTDVYPRCEETLDLLKPVIERFQPEYGIGFTRNFYHGPTFYVRGIGCNGRVSVEDEENLIGWFSYARKRFVWRHGQIRDVYPWNFLTAPQLNAKVGEATLRDWIGASPSRGILRPVTSDMLLWDVPESDIPAVRQVLWDAGVIFDYHKIIDQQTNWATEEEVMQWALGGRKPEDVKVLKVEGGGKARELSAEDVERLQGKQGRPK
jgi:hypothetical protein